MMMERQLRILVALAISPLLLLLVPVEAFVVHPQQQSARPNTSLAATVKTPTAKRSKTLSSLVDWAEAVEIK